MGSNGNHKAKIVTGQAGYVLQDVPHLSDYIPDLPVSRRFSSFLISLFCLIANFALGTEFLLFLIADVIFLVLNLIINNFIVPQWKFNFVLIFT